MTTWDRDLLLSLLLVQIAIMVAIVVWVASMLFSLARLKPIHFRRAEREVGSQPRNSDSHGPRQEPTLSQREAEAGVLPEHVLGACPFCGHAASMTQFAVHSDSVFALLVTCPHCHRHPRWDRRRQKLLRTSVTSILGRLFARFR